MPGITVKGIDSAVGAQKAGGQTTWFVNEQLIVLLGDPVEGHGLPPHAAPTMVQASGWMTINGVPVVHAGDKANCGHATTGQSNFLIE